MSNFGHIIDHPAPDLTEIIRAVEELTAQSGPPTNNHYNCREANGTMKPLPPGQTRQALFCPDCTHAPRHGPHCLFYHNPNSTETKPKRRLVYNSTPKYTAQDMINVIKTVWTQLGHYPTYRTLYAAATHPTANYISKHYPGGFKAARREAERQLRQEGKL